MIVPVGQPSTSQTLYLFEAGGKLKSISLLPTLFVPMTGKAEDNRVVKPDPANPELYNGGFEIESRACPPVGTTKGSSRWSTTFTRPKASTTSPSATRSPVAARRSCKDWPSMAGWSTRSSCRHGCAGRRFGPTYSFNDVARMLLVFYDEDRRQLAAHFLGPWTGTFDWRQDSEHFAVPPKAREANVFLGLCGATGELSLDDVRLTPVKKK